MNCPLVVLTYPGHFLLTCITIQSYFGHNLTRPVIVVLDDLSSSAWDTYVNDCTHLYLSLGIDATFVLTSALPEAHLFKQNNWVRQQIIKLYLNRLIESPSWLFSDGDIEYCCEVPVNKIPFTIVKPGSETQLQQNRYVSKLLKINQTGLIAKHPDMDWEPGKYYYQVCVSNPPWRWMNSSTLQNLQDYIQSCHDMTLAECHLILKDQLLLVTEWELIANFEHYVLKQPVDLVYYPTHPITNTFVNSTDINWCKTCYCTDSGLGREWFAHKGIAVSDSLWQTISSI